MSATQVENQVQTRYTTSGGGSNNVLSHGVAVACLKQQTAKNIFTSYLYVLKK